MNSSECFNKEDIFWNCRLLSHNFFFFHMQIPIQYVIIMLKLLSFVLIKKKIPSISDAHLISIFQLCVAVQSEIIFCRLLRFFFSSSLLMKTRIDSRFFVTLAKISKSDAFSIDGDEKLMRGKNK